MADDPDILRARLNKLAELTDPALVALPEDRARMERSIQLVSRALRMVAQVRHQTGNVARQREAVEVAVLCRRIVEAARAEGCLSGITTTGDSGLSIRSVRRHRSEPVLQPVLAGRSARGAGSFPHMTSFE
jgi:hypothetical protein